MLDVVITVSDTTPPEYLEECRRTVAYAASIAGYPVRVIEAPGVPGHIGEALWYGFAVTSAPYVAWVDDDDFVLPAAFTCLKKHWKREPEIICTRELHLEQNRVTPYQNRHHMTVFRRDILEKNAATWFAPASGLNRCYMTKGFSDVVDELSWVYVYRIWNSPGRKLRIEERPNGRSTRGRSERNQPRRRRHQ